MKLIRHGEFFFFQAEDGIRDVAVTGVQTCALPISILKRVNCDQVGVCVDTGNSIALLEDPMEVVEALAPWAFSTHVKDMGIGEYPEGFLLAEVPLGTGMLDLPRMVGILRKAHPEVRFILEMITRDPL